MSVDVRAGAYARRRRSFWKRRRFWVSVLAILAAVALTLWLIRSLADYRPPAE